MENQNRMRTSGPIRSALGPTLKVLRQHVASAKSTLTEEMTPENVGVLKNERRVLQGVLDRMERQNELWTEFINSLPADQIQAELDIYNAFPPKPAAVAAADHKFLVDLIEEGAYVLDMINGVMDEQENAEREAAEGGWNMERVAGGIRARDRTPAARAAQPRLPQIEVPKFNGDAAKWPQFWDLFENCIDSQPISAIEKMSYLLTRLEGSAGRLVAGYVPSNENYKIVVRLLKERFGDERVIGESLQRELMGLPRPNESASSMRNFVDSVERICRQLKGYKIDENNPFFATTIRERLPHPILAKLVEKEKSEKRV